MGSENAVLFVGFFSCMAKLCSDLKQEQYSMVWSTITTPRRHQRDSIELTGITLDFPFLLVEWIICEILIWTNLFYMLKKKKKPWRTNAGDWSPQSVVRYKLTRLETCMIFVEAGSSSEIHLLPPGSPCAQCHPWRQLHLIRGAYQKAVPMWGLLAIQGANQRLWPH